MDAKAKLQESREIIRSAQDVLKNEVRADDLDMLDPIESVHEFHEMKRQWLFASALHLAAMTDDEVAQLTHDEQRIRKNLIQGAIGLRKIREINERNLQEGLDEIRVNFDSNKEMNKSRSNTTVFTHNASKIIIFGLAISLFTGLARPISSNSSTPGILGWIVPETRSILLESPLEFIAEYIGFGIGGAILPAVVLYGVYWCIKSIFKPGYMINWWAVLTLSAIFSLFSVVSSYRYADATPLEGVSQDVDQTAMQGPSYAAPPLELPTVTTDQSVMKPINEIQIDRIRTEDWAEVGMGCAYWFETASDELDQRLIGSFDEPANFFFRVNGEERSCSVSPAPEVDKRTTFQCDAAKVNIVPSSHELVTEDGRRFVAEMKVLDAGGEARLTGSWGYGC